MSAKREKAAVPPVAACPSCGRRPSERVAIGWRPEYEGPTTIACSDPCHAAADLGPMLLGAAAELLKSDFATECQECAVESSPAWAQLVEAVKLAGLPGGGS